MDKFKTGIIGAATPIGAELVRLISEHPMCELTAVSSSGREGHPLSGDVPRLRAKSDMLFVSESELIDRADVVFCADDSLDAQEIAAACINAKSVLIDLGADFRFSGGADFALWHGGEFRYPALHSAAVYSIPELFREQLAGRVLVSCPGAVANAAIIALVPALLDNLIGYDGITINACLPAAVCRRADRRAPRFADVHNVLFGSAPGEPPETGEIELMLSAAAEATVHTTVTETAVPVGRSMLVTCRASTRSAANEAALRAAYEKYYASERFVRMLPHGEVPSTRGVEGTNFIDIGIERIERTGSVVITAALDWFMKGTAGQAVQSMNALLNMPEYFGLDFAPANI